MLPIMMTTPAPEPDARPRPPGTDEGKRRAAGSAFEGAIRSLDAGEKGPRSPREATVGEEAPARTRDDRKPDVEETVETPDLVVVSEKATDANPRLGDVLAFLTLAAKTEPVREAADTDAATAGAVGEASHEGGDVDATVGGARLEDKARMRLAVLRMETHFEPTMQTPVLVEAEVEAVAEALADATEGLGQILVGLKKALDERGSGDERRAGTVAAKAETLFAEADLDRTIVSAAKESVAETKRSERVERQATASGVVDGLATAAKVQARQQSDGVRTVFLAAREADRPALVSAPTTSQASVQTMSAQVAATVIDALPSPDAPPGANAPRAPAEAELRMRAGGAALKTLTIQLQPEHLGVLDISMRLVDGQLSLELSADKADTARMLLEDRAGLKSLLEQAGFSIDDASITVVTREAAMNASGRGADQGGDRSSPDGGRQDASGQGAERSFGDRRDDRPARRGQGAAADPAQHRGSSVFL